MPNSFQNVQDCFFNRHYSAYPKDDVRILKPTHQYSGNVTRSTESQALKLSEQHVDDAVLVTSTDSRTRQTALKHFNMLANNVYKEQVSHHSDRNKGITATVLGTTFGTGAVYCLASAFLGPLSAVPIIAGGAVATIMEINQWRQSQNSISSLKSDLSNLELKKNEWNDPIDSVINQRRMAGKQGFQYVFNNNLKNIIVHPEEVTALWMRDFINLINNPIDVVNIFNQDLLGNAPFQYAWENRQHEPIHIGQRIIFSEHLYKMSELYQKSHKAFNLFEKEISNEFTTINQLHTRYLNEINSLRNQWLIPAEKMFRLGSQEAEYLYQTSMKELILQRDQEITEIEKKFYYIIRNPTDLEEIKYKSDLDILCQEAVETVRREFQRHPAVVAIKQAYEKDCRMNTLLYNQSKMIVSNFFDQRVHQLNKETTLAREEVEKQRLNGHQHFSNLLNRIFHCEDNFSLDCLSINSPLITRNWDISNPCVQLSWPDVYGQLPSFHSAFANDISESAWNRFWGIQGLGCFASQPACSWNNLFTDRSHFPLRDNWFNVRTCSQQFKRPTFYRPVVVPPPPSKREPQNQRPPVCQTTHTRAPEEHNNPLRTNVGERVPVGPGSNTQGSANPNLSLKPTSLNNNRVLVGDAATKRKNENPIPPIKPEQSTISRNSEDHVRVGYAATTRKHDIPTQPLTQQQRNIFQNNENRVRVGYSASARRPENTDSVNKEDHVRVGYVATSRRP